MKNCCTICPLCRTVDSYVMLFFDETRQLSSVSGGLKLEIWNCHSADGCYSGFSNDELEFRCVVVVSDSEVSN